MKDFVFVFFDLLLKSLDIDLNLEDPASSLSHILKNIMLLIDLYFLKCFKIGLCSTKNRQFMSLGILGC